MTFSFFRRARPVFAGMTFALTVAGVAPAATVHPAFKDAFVEGGSRSDDTDRNYGGQSSLLVKRHTADGTSSSDRKAFVTFDLNGYGPLESVELQLTLTGMQSPQSGLALQLWGVADGDDGWNETTINADAAPGATTDYHAVDPGVILGELALPDVFSGDVALTFGTSALLSFLNDQRGADGLATIALFVNLTGAYEVSLASRENVLADGPALLINAGTVPLPAAGLLALGGFGVLGVVGRRRRRAAAPCRG